MPNLNHPKNPATTTCPQVGTYSAGDGWKWVGYDQQHNRCTPIRGNGCSQAFEKLSSCTFIMDNTRAQCQIQNTGGSVSYQFGIKRQKEEKKVDVLPDVPFSLLPDETKKIEFQKVAVLAWVDGDAAVW